MRILNEIFYVFFKIIFPLMITENLPPTVFDLLLVEGSLFSGLRATQVCCALGSTSSLGL